jgi:NADH dehydrogenase FAD-containing subunit
VLRLEHESEGLLRFPINWVCGWTGGLKAITLAQQNGVAPGRGGRLGVERDLTTPGHATVFSLGDLANPKDQRLRLYHNLLGQGNSSKDVQTNI